MTERATTPPRVTRAKVTVIGKGRGDMPKDPKQRALIRDIVRGRVTYGEAPKEK